MGSKRVGQKLQRTLSFLVRSKDTTRSTRPRVRMRQARESTPRLVKAVEVILQVEAVKSWEGWRII
ncbi:hypothetical protein TRAPUB_8405 [Trametes pubescens]|uniref:Uncharacterized protein n=1 Tax=Trametes pubescens TaxID=154538 RepID=A0A1M2W5C2_TRAPU|nr:hypothetical protein TRAPUB_8405 [Trametes pubescens]